MELWLNLCKIRTLIYKHLGWKFELDFQGEIALNFCFDFGIEESHDPASTPPKKKQKRKCIYKKEWEEKEEYKDWLRQKDNDNTTARCLFDTITFATA